MVTGVSVIPKAILESVLPVQGQTTKTSKRFLGPIGSAAGIVDIISFLHI